MPFTAPTGMSQISVPVAICLDPSHPKFTQKRVPFTAPSGMPQISVPVAILLRTITSKIYTKRGCRLWHPLGCPRLMYLLPFCLEPSHPKFTQKWVPFTAPTGMPQINVPVAILLRTITSKIYTKIGAIYGTHWDAPD